ncbi:MAG: DUF1566 domain-containing protein [Verrucomicrobiota bacterium]
MAVLAMGLVTAGVSLAAAPAGRYVIASGAVYDTKTNLTWQQGLLPGMYTQAEATAACTALTLNGAAWRLPTMREMLTIVDLSVGPPGPTIDAKAFPNTPAGFFWSATPYSGTPTNFWSTNFQYGFAYGNTMSDTSYTRCVSSGRAPGIPR